MATKPEHKYFEAVGRRKTAIARVRIFEGGKQSHVVNERPLTAYFATKDLQSMALESLAKAGHAETFSISAKINGGGVNSQAEAVRLGVARALLKFDHALRPTLKSEGHLKRDPRAVERKHFGLKKARRAPQWSKR
jgi:small subunit ribosomal protein S9